MAKRRKVGNLLALSLLSLLAQKPMYPYEMAQTLRVARQGAELQGQLGLALHRRGRTSRRTASPRRPSTDREGRQPERTTYQITGGRPGRAAGLARRAAQRPRGRAGRLRHGAVRGRASCPPDEVIGLLTDAARHLFDKDNAKPPGRPRACGPSACRGCCSSRPSTSSPCASPRRPGCAGCSASCSSRARSAAWTPGGTSTRPARPPPEFAELDELAKEGVDRKSRRPQAADGGPGEQGDPVPRKHDPGSTVRQHREPRSQTSPPAPRAARSRRPPRPSHECTPGPYLAGLNRTPSPGNEELSPCSHLPERRASRPVPPDGARPGGAVEARGLVETYPGTRQDPGDGT